MSDRITLMGSEQIQSAGYAMRQAAEQMNHAAGNLDAALQRHERFMDDWLLRLQNLLESQKP